MPAVALFPEVPWWRRLLRRSRLQPASTVWTLVEYDEQGDTLPLPVNEAMELLEERGARRRRSGSTTRRTTAAKCSPAACPTTPWAQLQQRLSVIR